MWTNVFTIFLPSEAELNPSSDTRRKAFLPHGLITDKAQAVERERVKTDYMPLILVRLEELDLIDRDDEQKFLSSADFLVTNAMPSLITNMQSAVSEVLKGMQLKDVITTRVLQETLSRIVEEFMCTGSPHHWVDYLMMPQDTKLSRNTSVGSSDETVSKFHQLMVELF
ncbi:hypothetical protein Rs2_34584 [Raphanus sativus]|nr:hypothetical protein Rs2_34584 [Raphanus sativus]